MSAHHTSSRRSLISLRSPILSLFLMFALLVGCEGTDLSGTSTTVSPASQNKPEETPKAEITFIAHLPAKLAEGQTLYVDFLDEVTGLALNPARAKMISQDGQSFGVRVPFPVGSVLKYRYVRDNDPIGVEYNTLNQQVRYRLYYVNGTGIVHDTISGWKTELVKTGLGRIRGQVANKTNNSPVVNALVTAGGLQTLTASDGSFLLEGLPPGTHNLVVYNLDGAFQPFQQGAVVAVDSTTPALILLQPASLVSVTFTVRPPKDNLKGVQVRMVGNILPLGNTFADMSGGMNVVASRAPLMTILPDGRYSLTLKLPAGTDLRYKYTLGDGFWNAERTDSGDVRVRQVIVAAKTMTIEDTIDTWTNKDFAPIAFNVTVPADTPAADTISIQFNPFGWTEPIPMWPTAKNQWLYVLYSPLNMFTSASYRYCRNEQCGVADAVDTRGPSAQGMQFSPKASPQTFNDSVSAWALMNTASEAVIVSAAQISGRGASFMTGAELMTGYRPSWQPYLSSAFQNLKDIGSNSVMLTPTWHATRNNPPVLEPVTGRDPFWYDLSQMSNLAQQKGLGVVVHPVLQYNEDPANWWKSAVRDDGWWQTWFAHYRTFLLYHADLAAQTGAKALVIGDESILPALPGGLLTDGTSSNIPGDAEQRWSGLIADIRTHYKGKLMWLIPYSGKMPPAPNFISEVDMLYVQLSAPLITSDQPSQADLESSIAAALDSDILKVQEKTNHAVILGLQYPSVLGAFDGCVGSEGNCLPLSVFQQPAPNVSDADLGFKDQAEAYSAVLSVVNQRSWISGFFAVGYNPAVELKDASISIRNKPASDVLWYWYPRLSGQK